jgi:hypothetical protein
MGDVLKGMLLIAAIGFGILILITIIGFSAGVFISESGL